MVCTHARFLARSRRGWNMTALLPELAHTLPRDLQLDGELVAYGPDGRPDFHRLSARMLHGDTSIPVTFWVFDLLAVNAFDMTAQPYSRRRSVLEALDIQGLGVRLVETVDDGTALFDADPGAQPRRRGGEAGARPVPARRAAMGEDEEQEHRPLRGGVADRPAPSQPPPRGRMTKSG